MPLQPDFQFTQANLQDYVDCPRRFQLRHLLGLAWPALIAEPAEAYEQHLADGETFHRLIQQQQLGLPLDRLAALVAAAAEETPGSPLPRWWQAYLALPPDLPPRRFSEITLTAGLAGRRLLAKYDLIALDPGRATTIVDWKTSQQRPTPASLANRLQTRVYRYLLTQAGSHLNDGQPIPPGQISMLYWFAEHPDQPVRLNYDAAAHAADERYLTGLITEITTVTADEADFPLTDDARRCRFCPYRSLCDRGVTAGGEEDKIEVEVEVEVEALAGFDFEQVAEVAF